MWKLLATTAMLSSSLTAAIVVAATVMMPPNVTLPPAPKASPASPTPQEMSKMSPEELRKRNLGTLPEHPIPGPIEGGKNVAPSPVPPSPSEQHLVKQQEQLPAEHGAPVGEVIPITSASIPKGWADCAQTKAADACKRRAVNDGLGDKVKYIIKLPDSGKVADLNAFIDAGHKRMSEERPQ